MASSLYNQILKIIGDEVKGMQATNTEDANFYAPLLKAELVSQINNADMPAGVKSALISSISVAVLSLDTAVISVTAMRPSIFDVLGAPVTYGSVDLALVYDHKSALKSSAKVYSKDPKIFLPIGKISGFARGYTNNYLQKTAVSFMTKYPDCTVTVSK